MEKCKAVEAKIELFKSIFEKLILLLIALGGGIGTLLVKYPNKYLLLSFSIMFEVFFVVGIIIVVNLWGTQIKKLNRCREEE